MGDGVLCYFGWPRAHEDAAEGAVRAGLAAVAAVARLRAPDDTPLVARVGIATGLVVSGPAGEGGRGETAVGRPLNLAARLQEVAGPGAVVIADDTRRLLGEAFALRDLGTVGLKGFAHPARAFEVLSERPGVSRFEARHGSTLLPMLGRDHELALLLERWRLARSGEGHAVLLTGEPGIGKSRIVRALADALESERPVVLRYQCSPLHADSPLWPVAQQLTFAADLSAHPEKS
jgi:AAA ATPase domain/Adenylate and Guanylate cyclase catalytic domain